MTSGAVDPHFTLDVICNGTTKLRRNVMEATRLKVMPDYNVPVATTEDIELNHLIPLALGGLNAAAANLWPEPGPDYGLRERLEVEMQRRACVAYRTLVPAEAEAVLAQEQEQVCAGGMFVGSSGQCVSYKTRSPSAARDRPC